MNIKITHHARRRFATRFTSTWLLVRYDLDMWLHAFLADANLVKRIGSVRHYRNGPALFIVNGKTLVTVIYA